MADPAGRELDFLPRFGSFPPLEAGLPRVLKSYAVPIAIRTDRTALAPSPAAAATRFIEPRRISPAAKTPGTLVSNGRGRRSKTEKAAISGSGMSPSVSTNPSSSKATP
jgi:hypothetical protein